jgi:WD40 repeat protein
MRSLRGWLAVPADASRRFLVAAGTEHYDGGDELVSVPEDLRKMVGFFGRLGYYEQLPEVRLDPSSTALRRALSEWLNGSDRQASDTAVIYYSGHGDSHASYFYLLTADSKENRYADTALRADYVLEALGENPRERRVLLILDACYAGQGAFNAADVAARMSHWQNFNADDEGVWVVAAASPKQEAQERLFADAFIEAAEQLQQTTGTLQPYIGLEALIWQINTILQRRGKQQRASWIPATQARGLAPFIPNLRYEPNAPANVDLETREWLRRRHAAELAEYWGPKARGVEVAAQAGWYFTGRQTALTELARWIADPAEDARLRVLTGDPGSGKSAVLGRLVTLADTSATAKPPGAQVHPSFMPPAGSIATALLARGKTADELLAELAASLGVAQTADLREILPNRPGLSDVGFEEEEGSEKAPACRVMIIDALDEASDPQAVIEKVISPLQDVASPGGGPRLLVATRRYQPLLGSLPSERVTIDLDQDTYSRDTDTAEYVAKVLLADDDPDSPTPYRNKPELARAVARQIAVIAGHSFLIAQIASRTLARTARALEPSEVAADRERWRDVGAAFDRDLDRYGDEVRRVRELLTPLAWAEGSGLPRELWAPLATALADGQHYSDEDITWLLEHAGCYLVETLDQDRSVYRLYHEQFAEHLRAGRSPNSTHKRITAELLRHIPVAAEGRREWLAAAPYIRTYLATHAAKARVLDQLVNDPGFLLAADSARLLPTLATITDPQARKSVGAFASTQHLLADQPAGQAAAQLDLAARVHGASMLSNGISHLPYERPWTVAWGRWTQPDDHVLLGRHAVAIQAVAAAALDGTSVIVSCGDGVQMWDLRTGTARGEPLRKRYERVVAAAITEVDGLPVAVTSGADGTAQVWDLATWTARGEPLRCSPQEASAVTIGKVDGAPVVVTGGFYGIVRVWDLRTGTALKQPLHGLDSGVVGAVAVGEVDNAPVVVTGSFYGTVQFWDLRTGMARGRPQHGHIGGICAVAVGEADGTSVAVTSGIDGAVRVWDLRTGTGRGEPLCGPHGEAKAVAIGAVDGAPVAVTGDADGAVQVWDLRTGVVRGKPLHGSHSGVRAVAVGEAYGAPIVITGSADGTVRVWDLRTRTAREEPARPLGGVDAVAVTEVDGDLVAVTGATDGTVQVWDLHTGTARGKPLRGPHGGAKAVALGEVDGALVAITSAADGMVQAWDLHTGTARGKALRDPYGMVTAVAAGKVDGTPVVVTGSLYGRVQVWDLRTGTARGGPLHGPHGGKVSAVAVGEVDGAPVAVVGGADGAVRVWDLRTGTARAGPLHGPHSGKVSAVAAGEVSGIPVIVSGNDNGTISISAIDCAQGTSASLDAPAGITAIAFAGQIGWLTSTKDGSLFMWRPASPPGSTPQRA